MSTISHHDQIAPSPTVSANPPAPQRRVSSSWQCLRNAAPTAVVITALVGLAVWGHSTDWTIPKFSALTSADTAKEEPWCQDHNVPELECIECNPPLLPAKQRYGWCKVHGVTECPLERPDVAQLKELPTVTAAMMDRASRALALRPRPENNAVCKLHERRIQFASVQAVAKAGIDIALVQERPVVEAVVANGEVVYDETRMAHLPSRVAGTVWSVEKQVGDRVHRGDVLTLIDAAEVGRAKGEFLQAISQARLKHTNLERLRPLADSGIVMGRQFVEAEAADQEAWIRLQTAQQSLINLGLPIRAEEFTDVPPDEIARRIQFLGLPPDLTARLDAASTTSNLFPIRSPLDGVVIDRNVVKDEPVDTATVLFAVADVSRLWLMLNVRQEDAKYVSLGQQVLFQPSDRKHELENTGTVSWISTAADDQTRTVRVRVGLPNADGRLLANTFGTGRIVLRDEPAAIVVPTEALHWDGACHVVFVRDKNYFRSDAPKFFHVRSVRPGVKNGEITEIIAGLLPGEVIASKNSVVLEAQLLKANLGAGCCEVEAK
ncbi:MAG: efflux RND transporter periplasmic adaptor subunit [Planctomycetes bacterium]|nr:efflux RND transporter periplasmic adaptor subunit [Planctomycetota bacterium]